MSYDLAVWEGPTPESDQSAAEHFARLMGQLDAGASVAQPSAAINEYVNALLAVWPDITTDAGEDSPWADGPLIGNAFGNAIYFAMVWSRAEEASELAASIAHRHGLVCYDPQLEAVRSPSSTGPRSP